MVQIYYRFTNFTRYSDLHREAYRLLRDAMQRDFGICTDAYELCKTQFGKPYYKDCPYRFSISHTDALVAVAISSFEVGLDVEMLNRTLKKSVAMRFLQNELCDIWDWVRYESIGKLFGVGIPFSKEEIDQSYTAKNCNVISGYAVCCASFEKDFSLKAIKM